MQEIIDNIRKLFATYTRENIISLEKIPQSGSNRIYFRLSTDSRSFIVTYGINIQENRTFIYFSRHFFSRHCPVPEIFIVNGDQSVYIQEDFGDVSLLSRLEE